MDLTKYQALTGITVSSEDAATVTAQINRTRTILESKLGYTLKKSLAGINQYEEKGKASVDCMFNGIFIDNNDLTLLPPDDVQGSYRLFPYNRHDKYFAVDPFTTLYKVKLVFIESGDEPNGITHKTFSSGKMRVDKLNNISKYIERCRECFCTCLCDHCVQIAIDADWLNETCLPDDLLYLWADMVTWYTDCKKDIQREALGTHMYIKFDRPKPEELPESIAILQRYAGPNGSMNAAVVV